MKSGNSTYIWQRLTAILLLYLVPWTLYSFYINLGASQHELIIYYGSLKNSCQLFLAIFAAGYHGYLGLKSIMYDYIASPKLRVYCFASLSLVAIVIIVYVSYLIVQIQLNATFLQTTYFSLPPNLN